MKTRTELFADLQRTLGTLAVALRNGYGEEIQSAHVETFKRDINLLVPILRSIGQGVLATRILDASGRLHPWRMRNKKQTRMPYDEILLT